MIRTLVLAALVGSGAPPVWAEMRTDDLNGVRIGMSPAQAIAALRADYQGEPTVTAKPCTAAARSCITAIVGGTTADQTSVFLVEDTPGAMRVYAAVSIILSQPWTDREQAAWEAVVARDLGQPDCLQLGAQGRFRAWSRRGNVGACAALPLPESEDLPPGVAGINAGSPINEAVIWEFQGTGGRLHQMVLIDPGFYRARKR